MNNVLILTVRVLCLILLLMLVFAVAAPGLFRAAVLQPPRDALFFMRELEPFEYRDSIETRRVEPNSSYRLDANPDVPNSVDLHVDIWKPTHSAALNHAGVPTAILVHGSSPRGRLLGFNMLLADSLRSAGWLVISADSRGFGSSGNPVELNNADAWLVRGDLRRLMALARRHPASNGAIVAVGHSLGGSHLFEAFSIDEPPAALALIGPSRDVGNQHPTLWQRIRFSADRLIGRPIHRDVIAAMGASHDLLNADVGMLADIPVLLLDGEREGDRLIEVLRDAATRLGPRAQHVTVTGSHHYCGTYQLPVLNEPIFTRPEIFERCATALLGFLDAVVQDRLAGFSHSLVE